MKFMTNTVITVLFLIVCYFLLPVALIAVAGVMLAGQALFEAALNPDAQGYILLGAMLAGVIWFCVRARKSIGWS